MPSTGALHRACAVCGAAEGAPWLRPTAAPGPVVRCSRCGFVYIDPIEHPDRLPMQGPVPPDAPLALRESARLEDITGEWDRRLIDSQLRELAGRRASAAAALARLEALAGRRGSLLDVGCFCGVLLDLAAQHGWDCWGIEPLVAPAIYARGRYQLRVFTGTLDQHPFAPATFDALTALQVLEHVVDPRGALTTMRDLLRPGGLLMVEVPRIDTAIVRLLGRFHRHFVADHLSFFSRATLTRLLADLGFRIRATYTPDRIVSLRHLLWWVGRYSKLLERGVGTLLPDRLRARMIRLRPPDILSVVGEKI